MILSSIKNILGNFFLLLPTYNKILNKQNVKKKKTKNDSITLPLVIEYIVATILLDFRHYKW